MNYLAHLHLSGNDEGLILGNYIGDSVKGKNYNNYPLEIKNGILLHRFIDSYTDDHPVTERSRVHLRPVLRKYAGVAVDMFYDHFLATHWNLFSNEPLDDFSKRMYGMLNDQTDQMPAKAKQMLPYMIKDNWLASYADMNSMQRFMTGLSRRTKFESGMQHSVKILWQEYEDFESHFHEFYPDIQHEVKKFISDIEL